MANSKRKLPLYEVNNFENFREMLNSAKEEAGDTIAIKYKERSSVHDVTYNELAGRIDALGTALSSLNGGLDHVAIIGENSYPWICAYLSVLCSEGVVIPVDKELPFSEILNILNHSDCTTVFFDSTFEDRFKKSKNFLPNVRNFISFQARPKEENEEILAYDSLIYKGEMMLHEGCTDYISLSPANDRMSMLVYKAGSTDSLKGIMLSQFALRSAVLGILQLTPFGTKCLSVLPYDRPFELVGGLLCSFHSHATVCIGNGSRNFSKNLQYYKPDYMFLTPLYVEKIWQKILKNCEKQGCVETMEKLIKTSNAMRKVGIDKRKSFFSAINEMLGGKLETIFVLGAAANPDAMRFYDNIGITTLCGYGVSECASIISINREKFNDFTSAGVLLPCMQVKIDCPNEEGQGEICVRGDVLMMGYYKNNTASKALTELSGWFHTGDLGKINAKGQLYITGKLRNDIVFKDGRSVYPEEIESYLLSLSGIKSARIYAGKNAEGAELSLAADIILDEEYFADLSQNECVTLIKEKIDALNATLPSYKRLDSVHIRK